MNCEINLSIQSLVADDKKGKLSPGRDGDRYIPLDSSFSPISGVAHLDIHDKDAGSIQKTKRFAISAEPSNTNAENEEVEKFPKGLE